MPWRSSKQTEIRERRAPEDVDGSERINERRDRACRAALPILSAASGVMLLLSLFLSGYSMEAASGVASAVIVGVTGVALIVGAWNLTRQAQDGSNCHQAALVVVSVTAVSLAFSMAASGSLNDTAFFELLVVVAGAVMLRPGWYAAALGSLWAIWLGVTALLSGTESSSRWFLGMIGATVISVAIHMMRVEGVKALSRALGVAEAEAVEDVLTGLLNRRGLHVVGSEMMALSQRSREALGATFIDVDGLKIVNDEQGHERGDEVLVMVADALTEVFRASDLVARWGGDEFVVLALGSGPSAEEVERRLGSRLQSHDSETFGDDRCGVSAGRVVHMPWQDEGLEEILDRADQEMYRRRRLRRAQGRGSEAR